MRHVIVCRGVGAIIIDTMDHTLTPISVLVALRLWGLIQVDAEKAVARMLECERWADRCCESQTPWLWDLPVSASYQPDCCC